MRFSRSFLPRERGRFSIYHEGFIIYKNYHGLTRIDANKIRYTVDAPTFATSTTRLYLPEKNVGPISVSGASSWSWSGSTRVLTVRRVHSSPAPIVVVWGASHTLGSYVSQYVPGLSNSIYNAWAIQGIIIMVLVAALIMMATRGNINIEAALMVIGFSITLIFVTIIIVRILELPVP